MEEVKLTSQLLPINLQLKVELTDFFVLKPIVSKLTDMLCGRRLHISSMQMMVVPQICDWLPPSVSLQVALQEP